MEGTGGGTAPGTPDGDGAIESELVGEIQGVPQEGRWLIDKLWSSQAVGIIGGTPKTGKTWFTLEFAVAVASGTPALGEFAVAEPGPVVVFPAEDDPRSVRDRVAGIAMRKGVELSGLPLHVITANALKLDEEGDRRGLAALIERVKPKLVVLDPLVRLHSGDENYAGHISELLGFLRGLQRQHACAILVTHHVSKRRGPKGTQMGQALRGSGELHAWGDSNLYLTKTEQGLVKVEVEHRSAPALDPFFVALHEAPGGTYLELVEVDEEDEEPVARRPSQMKRRAAKKQRSRPPALSLRERVIAALRESRDPVSQVQLREALRVRNQVLTNTLRELQVEGLVVRPDPQAGWRSVPEPVKRADC